MTITPTIEQQRFIDYYDRSILLQACVGTGKTFALAHRVAKAIKGGVPAERILCVTFTNRAAQEMRQRIHLYCPNDSHKVVTKTFHGLCAWILRLGAQEIGIPQDFAIIDEDDAIELINLLDFPKRLSMKAVQVYQMLQSLKTDGMVIQQANAPDISRDHAEQVLAVYQLMLAGQKSLDFADLISETLRALQADGPLQDDWIQRFDLVQVDEMQDTHPSEYQIISTLAKKSQNLVLSGDFDQTIYEWRGSDPELVLADFRRDFPACEEIHFTVNHRGTKTLIKAAQAVVKSYSGILPEPANSTSEGNPIVIHGASSERDEAKWISQMIKSLAAQGVDFGQIGVLTRSNRRATTVSQAMEEQNVPHLTVETYQFFRRQEVKDCLAYFKFLFNRDDSLSLRRILRRPSRGIGERTVEKIDAAKASGLRLTDFAAISTLENGDPYASLLQATEEGTLIIFDCETTGTDPAVDDIVEISAYKVRGGELVAKFHKYLRPRKPVGDSVFIHNITDEFLAEHGEDCHQALKSFLEFIGDGLLIGHNVTFDIRMVQSACQRCGLLADRKQWADTLSLARRFIATNSYKLEELAKSLRLAHQPTHAASDDVAATWDLLQYLLPLIAKDAGVRRKIVAEHTNVFLPLANHINKWWILMHEVRPAALLQTILEESGLLNYYRPEAHRIENINELVHTFTAMDDPSIHPVEALDTLVNFATLSRNIDREDLKDRVAVLTVHQAKGLEFDIVFMAGLSAYEFPNYGATKAGRELEERRLFYVGITRAKKELYLSYWQERAGRMRAPSEYLLFVT